MIPARLAWLYLRARLAGRAAACLVGVAAATWFLLGLSDDRMLIKLILIVLPLAPAAVIGAGLRSPFGETEVTASRPMPPLRLAHLAGLLAVAALALAAANTAAPGEDFGWLLVRNGAGYAGLALIGGRLAGAAASWVVSVAYGMFVVVAPLAGALDRASPWLWPLHPPAERPAATIALALLLAGVAVAAVFGARAVPDEAP